MITNKKDSNQKKLFEQPYIESRANHFKILFHDINNLESFAKNIILSY